MLDWLLPAWQKIELLVTGGGTNADTQLTPGMQHWVIFFALIGLTGETKKLMGIVTGLKGCRGELGTNEKTRSPK